MDQSYFIGGKAAGLITLSGINGINVPAFAVIGARDSADQVQDTVRRFIAENPGLDTVAVRSSALVEDGSKASFAGAFKTVLNVRADEKDILAAIADVQHEGERKLADVFNLAAEKSVAAVVQRMIDAPDAAGVCLTQGFGAEDKAYLLINFRRGLGDSLVSGADGGTQLKVLRSGDFSADTLKKYPFLPDLRCAVLAIEASINNQPLDMEFAVKDGTVFMLQLRPLVTMSPALPALRRDVERESLTLARDVAKIPANDLYCDMTDINPRELLGAGPRQVNIDIFKRIFADDIVESARAEVGYAPLHQGLLRQVGAKPYVSMRAAAYSFRPDGLSDATYEKMASLYKRKLEARPDLQDKVEFDVFVTHSDQLPQFFAQNSGFFTGAEQREIASCFDRLDKRMRGEIRRFCDDYPAQIETLRRLADGVSAGKKEVADVMDALRQGTALFVKTARLAFYQKSLCDRLYGVDDVRGFLTALDTPSERLQRALHLFALRQVDEAALTREYGHIRPGQMDIDSIPYRKDIDKSLDLPRFRAMTREQAQAALEDMAQKSLAQNDAVAALGYPQRQDIADLRVLLAAREHVKHVFMRIYDVLAEKLRVVADVAPRPGCPVLLPPVLSQGTDLACLHVSQASGTYFTQKKVEAMPLVVTDDNLHSLTRADVQGKILIMDHADPGYDFLLLLHPAGIVTRVGGPASHIAIRVNEYAIPACIGCGIDPAGVDCSKPYILDCAAQRNYTPVDGNAAAAPRKKHVPYTP
jgi:hypothetical protein